MLTYFLLTIEIIMNNKMKSNKTLKVYHYSFNDLNKIVSIINSKINSLNQIFIFFYFRQSGNHIFI